MFPTAYWIRRWNWLLGRRFDNSKHSLHFICTEFNIKIISQSSRNLSHKDQQKPTIIHSLEPFCQLGLCVPCNCESVCMTTTSPSLSSLDLESKNTPTAGQPVAMDLSLGVGVHCVAAICLGWHADTRCFGTYKTGKRRWKFRNTNMWTECDGIVTWPPMFYYCKWCWV